MLILLIILIVLLGLYVWWANPKLDNIYINGVKHKVLRYNTPVGRTYIVLW